MATEHEIWPADVPRHRNSNFPWDQWLNGRPWTLVRGVDYQSSDLTMRATAHNAAGMRSLRITTRIHPSGGAITIQARHWQPGE